MSGIQWLILLGSALPVVGFCALAHTESADRHRAAIELTLTYEEGEGGARS
jgi:hypothetical protein